MKINGVGGTSSSSASRPSSRAGGGFSLSGAPAASPAPAAGAAASTGGVAGVSALMALQGVEDATERRRRAVRRGSGLLDRLDELKLALLGGQDGAAVLSRLAGDLREERPDEADPGLRSLLDQIDLRAAVELAKAEVQRRPA